MLVRRRGRVLASSFAALALTVAVTGCANQNVDDDVAAALPAQQGASKSPEIEPSESPRVDSESPDPEANESPDTEDSTEPEAAQEHGIRGKLLTAEEVPGFNEEFSWAVKSTRMREGQSPFGTCHKFAMTSIGAWKVVVRTYEPRTASPGATASHLVAEFADEMTAKRAFEVLKSWAGQCDEELNGYERSDVGTLKPVPAPAEVDGEIGQWYLLTYGPAQGDPGFSFLDAQGLTRVGSTISALEMRLVGQDYNYSSGEEPMVAAVQNAAVRLG